MWYILVHPSACMTASSTARVALLSVAVALAGVPLTPGVSHAVVTTTTRAQTFSPVSETEFEIDFPFTEKAMIKVTKTVASVPTVLTQGTHYSVTIPVGTQKGKVTTFVAVTTGQTLLVERVPDTLQNTSLRNQSSFVPQVIEAALDKLHMIVQHLLFAVGDGGDVEAHEGEADPHPGYVLLAGRSGGQNIRGGTGSGEDLQLNSTEHATKGFIFLGANSAYDQVQDHLGLNTTTPLATLDVQGSALIDSIFADSLISGVTGLEIHSNPTEDGFILIGDFSAFDEANIALGIGDTTPEASLHVVGDALFDTSSEDGDYRTVIERTSGYSLIQTQSDETNAIMCVASTDALGSLADITGICNYGPLHASRPYTVGLFASATEVGILNDTGLSLEKAPFRGRKPAVTADVAEVLEFLIDDNECNTTFFVDTDNTVIDLPNIDSNELYGCEITVINACADGGCKFSLSPDATNKIVGSCVGITGAGAATVVQVGGTDDLDVFHVKTTANSGDRIKVIAGDPEHQTTWWVGECIGEFDTESG